MTTLIVCAVDAECTAVARDLPAGVDVTIVEGGVGPVAAAVTTATALANSDYDCVISAGIAGGFRDRAAIGEAVVADASVAADLGCRTDDRFLTLHDLGMEQDPSVAFEHAAQWHHRLAVGGAPTRLGTVLTLSCMTGTDADGVALAQRHPDAVAEAMEGWGVAWAARSAGVPAGEVRAISNLVGRRDAESWDLTGAFDALSRTFAVLLAAPLP
ncbi:MAG: futalosine hydrolase [Acidimicrobiaceae bacterium]